MELDAKFDNLWFYIHVADSTVLRATRLFKAYLKVLHITLHVSADFGHHQAFKIVDENCCASVL
jgi:hypothetical protein